jgi:group II intron reverse transcriptase/maturase
MEWMREAYATTRKDGATGVDGQTAEQYAESLEIKLEELLCRAKSGTYRAPPVRRVYIPKGNGKGEVRPIGIPTIEDKVLQRAVKMVLDPLYEQEFLDCSYGFRPGRSAHGALSALRDAIMNAGNGWVLEVDIKKFFDTLKHHLLIDIVKHRVCDGVIIRLIGKWLSAGVQEQSQVRHPEEGTPQGGVISPLLSNIYLHTVLDKWFEEEIKPRLLGVATLIRYADDFVIVFRNRMDAERTMAVLPKRFAKYGLSLHPDKTRLMPFGRPRKGQTGPGTFDFLGFTHYWGKTRAGGWTVNRKTAKTRLSRSVKRIHQWLRTNRHRPVKEQWQQLCKKVRGHFNYFAITCNGRSVIAFREQVRRSWCKWLSRRSNASSMIWEYFAKLEQRYPLPLPKIAYVS